MHWKVLVERRFRRDPLEKGISGTGTVSPAQRSEKRKVRTDDVAEDDNEGDISLTGTISQAERSEEDFLKVKVIEDKARMMVMKMIIMVIMTIMIIMVIVMMVILMTTRTGEDGENDGNDDDEHDLVVGEGGSRLPLLLRRLLVCKVQLGALQI